MFHLGYFIDVGKKLFQYECQPFPYVNIYIHRFTFIEPLCPGTVLHAHHLN